MINKESTLSPHKKRKWKSSVPAEPVGAGPRRSSATVRRTVQTNKTALNLNEEMFNLGTTETRKHTECVLLTVLFNCYTCYVKISKWRRRTTCVSSSDSVEDDWKWSNTFSRTGGSFHLSSTELLVLQLGLGLAQSNVHLGPGLASFKAMKIALRSIDVGGRRLLRAVEATRTYEKVPRGIEWVELILFKCCNAPVANLR